MEELIKKLEEDYKDAQVQWLRGKAYEETHTQEFNSGKIYTLTTILMYLYKKNK